MEDVKVKRKVKRITTKKKEEQKQETLERKEQKQEKQEKVFKHASLAPKHNEFARVLLEEFDKRQERRKRISSEFTDRIQLSGDIEQKKREEAYARTLNKK